MNAKGRFGLIIPEINSPLDRDFVEGAFAQAQQLGYDIVVYTGVLNSMRDIRYDAYISGLENIYTLICTQHLDGIIFAAERFHTQEVIDKINDYLMQTDTPCLVLGGECARAVSMEADEYRSMYRITRHMTDEHKSRRLYCLAGIAGHKSSEERLRGFRDACADAGISVSESDIFYGGFWKDIPAQLGKDISDGRIECPDAVVCCNDVMAVSLIESLTKNGIRVPEDVKVTGFDGGWDSIMCQPSVTTIIGRDKQFGADAVCRIYAMAAGTMPKQELFTQTIRFGKSCGCCNETAIEPHLFDMILKNREKRNFIATDFIHRMSEPSTLVELSAQIDEVGHIFSRIDWLDICLCSDWQGDLNNPDNFRQYGCSDEMYLLLSKRFGDNDKAFYSFDTADIIPALNAPHEPHIIVMTSLHCSGQIFGYTAAAYTDSRYICADEYYISWCDSVSNGIKSLQKKYLAQHFSRQLEKLSETDSVTGIYNRRGFMLHAPEMINQYSSESRISYLLLLTYYPEKMSTLDPQAAIDGILLSTCINRLCARIGDNTYAVIIPSHDEEGIVNTTENLIAAIEAELRENFGDVKLPEFVTCTSRFNSADSTDTERTLYEALESLAYKKKAAENNYTDYKEQIYRLRRNMVSQPEKEWDIEKVARDIGISRSHLQRLFKQLFGASIKDDLINARIKRAKQLLAHTDMRVVEIAEQCGYNNEHHFMRQFNHNLMTADVDGDGRQEICMGDCVIDDNGKLLWSSGKGHGDAMHLGDFIPEREGLDLWQCHEHTPYGVSLFDAKSGKTIFHFDADKDTGRCCADNVWAGNKGAEFWGARPAKAVLDRNGKTIANLSPSMNFLIYWDGDLEREMLSDTMISKMRSEKQIDYFFTAEGCASNNSTKAVPCMTADLFGDWREELIMRTTDNKHLRIWCTTIPTDVRLTTLMHDPQYRAQNCCQQSAYNQPPHTSFFLGTGYPLPERPAVTVLGGAEATPFEIADGTLIKSLTVNDTASQYSWSIQSGLDTGKEVFSDRSSKFTSVPDKLKGTEWIRTACDSKRFSGDEASFTAARDITVYVGIDTRAESSAAWLGSWTKTPMTMTDDGTPAVTYNVYSMNAMDGEKVTLGAINMNAAVNYVVAVTEYNNGDIIGTTPAATPPQSVNSGFIYGDLNNDGIVDSFDMILMRRELVNDSLDRKAKRRADVDADGSIGAADAVQLQSFLLKGESFSAVKEKKMFAYAVDQTVSEGVEETANEGFRDKAYVNLDNKLGSGVEWKITAPVDGNYLCTFGIANGSADNRKMKIEVNGQADHWVQDFLTTGAWTTWQERGIVLPLKAGENTIKMTSTAESGGPNLDYLCIEWTDEPIAQIYEDQPTVTTPVQSGISRTIYIAGDSTVQTYNAKYAPQQGWGAYLGEDLSDMETSQKPNITIITK